MIDLGGLAGLAVGALVAALWMRRRDRRLRDQLRDARRRLDAARAARDAFFDLTTHELRSPLSAILGYQELLEDGAYGQLPDEARDAVRRLGRSARHLLHLIDGVVELSKLQSGAATPEHAATDLGAVMAATAETFRTHTAERGLTARVSVPDGLPIIRSDQDRLVRALDLLVTSAVRHPAADTLELDISAGRNEITVTLGPTDLDVDPDAHDPTDLGIRLAVVRGIAELLGGGLALRTESGRVRALVLTIRADPPIGSLTG